MISREELLTRNKIIGVLLRAARLRAGKEPEECAKFLSCDPEMIVRAEEGQEGLTLSQLETLAHALQVPLPSLLGEEDLPDDKEAFQPPPYGDIMILRRKMIGVILRQARLEAGRSLGDVAPVLGYEPEQLARVELGEEEVPLVELDLLAQTMGIPFERFVAKDVIPMTPEERSTHDMQQLAHLPSPIRDFVLKPINTPYLQIAMNLSKMPSETLRQIASGLLEITY